jgi:hypothetical protein
MEKELKEMIEGLKLIMVLEPWKNKKVADYLDGNSDLEEAPLLKSKIDDAIKKIKKGKK